MTPMTTTLVHSDRLVPGDLTQQAHEYFKQDRFKMSKKILVN